MMLILHCGCGEKLRVTPSVAPRPRTVPHRVVLSLPPCWSIEEPRRYPTDERSDHIHSPELIDLRRRDDDFCGAV